MFTRLQDMLRLMLGIMCILVAAAYAGPFGIDVTGTWDVSVTSQEGTAHPTIALRQNGEKITGTYSGKMGDSPLEGSLKGSDIRLTFTLKFQDVSYTVTYTGTVTENAMQGTARFGNAGTGDWSAKRRKAQD